MKKWYFARALTAAGWVDDYVVTVDNTGKISDTAANSPLNKDDVDEISDGWLIPGFVSGHSHAFQYAMAGVSEFLGSNNLEDDFWSWRSAMYELALSIEPEQMKAIAELCYTEMLRFGITHVSEFHYLHKDKEGKKYARQTEMAQQLLSAADAAGIQLCLVPVYYRTGDFLKPASEKQRRFLFADTNEYFDFLRELQSVVSEHRHHSSGIGIHSLRAAYPEEVKEIFASKEVRPMHIHIAEQRKEVESCRAAYGKTPIRWLLDEVAVDERFSLVHATHADAQELRDLALTKAVSVICPSTEGNLGDGFFSFKDYTSLGGRWAIGTDSHINLNVLEDLRWLDYQERLRLQKRNTLCRTSGDDSGEILFRSAIHGGRQSIGLHQTTSYFNKGESFAGIVLDADHPVFAAKPKERVLSCLIYSGDSKCYKGIISQGAWQVKEGHHRGFAKASAKYRSALRQVVSPRK